MKKTKEKKRKLSIWGMFKKGFGLFLIIIGIASLLLPIIPGILIILLGITFLKNEKITKYLSMKFLKKKKEQGIKKIKQELSKPILS